MKKIWGGAGRQIGPIRYRLFGRSDPMGLGATIDFNLGLLRLKRRVTIYVREPV